MFCNCSSSICLHIYSAAKPPDLSLAALELNSSQLSVHRNGDARTSQHVAQQLDSMPSGSRPDAANQEDLDLALGKLHGACVITVAGCQDML